MIKHCLFYHYGVHSVVVEVSKKDFFRVVDDLSKEFEIIKTTEDDEIDYSIVDYSGSNYVIGFIFEEGAKYV